MIRLTLALAMSVVGVSLLLHFLKNFFLKEKLRFSFDWDGMLERLCLTYIIMYRGDLWLLAPVIILLKVLFRISHLGFSPALAANDEPGNVFQKVLFKAELAIDLFLSPALAVFIGVVLR
ncbi:MAG: hypothetical protein JW782_04760 [Candidatus Saganbacteria bacterium]|nr:hypothetical protein [Candidatus Saganbacteria bacterium]